MLGNTNITIKPNEKIDYIDWIESTGTQYIDTGYTPSANTRVELDVQYMSTPPSGSIYSNGVSGYSEANPDAGRCGFHYENTTNYPNCWYFAMGSENIYYANIADTNRHLFFMDFAKSQYGIDNIIYDFVGTSFALPSGFNEWNIYLFARNVGYNTTTDNYSKQRLYKYKIYENENLIHNFKPCKDSAGVFCLYDTVTKKYFYNKGTGYFEGPNPKQVEYIESSGTQYIDTDYKPNSTTKMELDIELTKLNGNNVSTSSYDYIPVFGTRDRSVSPVKNGFCSFSGISNETIASFVYGTTDNVGLSVSGWLSRNLIIIDKNKYYFNNNLISTSTDVSTWQSTGSLFLLTVNSVDETSVDVRRTFAKIYGCKFYENDVLVRNFIPVYIGTYCLYDTVNQKYYYNKGTGLFGGKYMSAKTTVLMHYEDNINNETGLTSHSSVGTIQYGEGVVGIKSLKLNGSSCIKIPYSAPVTFGSSDFTIAGWFKQTGVASGSTTPGIWSHQYRYSSSYYYYGMRMDINTSTQKMACYYQTAYSAETSVANDMSITLNEWRHFALVRKGTTLTFYLDGVAMGSKTVSGSLYQNSSASFKIGSRTNESASDDNPQNYFVGEIDEFIIAKEALWNGNFVPPKAPYGTKEFYDVEV